MAEKTLESKSMFEDRISELPDAIILHVLSFLPTIVCVRMSVLSKRWRCIWTLMPVLDFYDSRDLAYYRRSSVKYNEQKKFFNFVDQCLKHHYEATTVMKFKLDTEYYEGGRQIDCWLRFLIRKRVKELDLNVRRGRSIYCLPSSLLCIRTLTCLKLDSLELVIHSPVVSLPSLKVLHLMDMIMDNKSLDNMLLGCPYLEKLYIFSCFRLQYPLVSSLSLKSMEFDGFTIIVEAANLHSFVYSAGLDACNINLIRCVSIRSLSISDVCLTSQWFQDLIPQLPFLECLNLNDCYGSHIKIINQRLKYLYFCFRTTSSNCSEVTIDAPSLVSLSSSRSSNLKVSVNAPSLVSFFYSCYWMYDISMNASNMLDVSIRFLKRLERLYDMEWYMKLIKFLSEFNGTKNLSIFCVNEKALIIPDELREIYPSPLPNLKLLRVKTAFPLFSKAMFMASLRWISPSLETLIIE